MKIKIEQLDDIQKDCISQALLRVVEHYETVDGYHYNDIRALARRIDHGEVLLCEWQYQANFEKCQK